MSNLFENVEWTGEFFAPDQYNNRFSGKLSYAIDEGVVLDYTVIVQPDERPSLPRDTGVLYGYLENGRRCTLVGELRNNMGISLDGGHSILRGRNCFPMLILNDFVRPDKHYTEVTFTLSGMQEFFSPEKRRSLLRLSKPLDEVETSYGRVGIYSTARLSPVLGIEALIHSDDGVALQELINSFIEIKNSHPKSHFEQKGEVSHYVAIRLNHGVSISRIYEMVAEIAGLFALLTCSPVYPESISIFNGREEGHLGLLELYPTIIAEQRTMAIATSRKHHDLMPITHSVIDLPKVLETWHAKSFNEYSVIISAIQHETGFRSRHSLHGEIVIYSSLLESISKKEGRTKSKDKYDYSIEKYASQKIQIGLKKVLQKVNEKISIGEIISDLRADIAHVTKKKVLTKLSLQDLADIVRCLQLIIIAYILIELGIDIPRVQAYQQEFMPKSDQNG
jgi:hypothetical protein